MLAPFLRAIRLERRPSRPRKVGTVLSSTEIFTIHLLWGECHNGKASGEYPQCARGVNQQKKSTVIVNRVTKRP